MAAKLAATPCGIYIFGYIEGNGTGDPASAYCYLSFPKPSGTYPNVHFGSADPHEAYLNAFDAAGLKIFLQVEPGDADVNMLIDLVMNRYKHHPCVIGFGLDLEWYQARSYTDGKVVTATEVQTWLNHLQTTHGSQYKLFLKHFSTSHVPTFQASGLVYLDDSLGHANLDAMASEFAVWGQRYSGSDVGFQFGYQEDQSWWQQYADPFKTISQRLQSITNTKYFIWVDFTITTVFPP